MNKQASKEVENEICSVEGESAGKTLWIFNHYAEEPSTGTGLRHYHLARQLEKMGWRPIVFAASSIHQSDMNLIEGDSPYVAKEIDGITFVYIKARNYAGNGKQRILNILEYTKGCLSVAPKLPKPQAILASSVHPLAWYLGSKFSKRYSVPWVCEVRDLWPESLIEFGLISRKSVIAKAIRAYEKWAYRSCDALVFTMPGGIDYVEEQGWQKEVPESKIFWISNGIDLNRFDSEAKEHVYHDADFEEEGYFRLLYCGSIGDSDALDGYFDALKELQDRGVDNVRLFLFGDGPRRKDLEEKCQQEGIDGVFFKGRVAKKYVPSLVSRSDANLLSVQWSGLLRYGCSFNKLFDYLAAGKPIVSNVTFGRSDFEEKRCGVALASEGDSLADLIAGLCAMPVEERDAMGARSRNLAASYDFSALAMRLNQAIERSAKNNSATM